MKRNFFLGLLALATMMSFSCSNDDDGGVNDNNSDLPQLISITSNGTWSVSSYLDDGLDETYHYAGYSFNFNTDGTVTAVSSSNTVNGTWSITGSSSSSSSGPDFNLFFPSPPDFEELSDDWDIIVINDTTIELRDVSGGDGSIDNLTFIKI